MDALKLDATSCKGLITSLALHIFVFSALIIGLLINTEKQKTPEHIFELVAKSQNQAPQKVDIIEVPTVVETPKIIPEQAKPKNKIVKQAVIPKPKKISYKDFINDHGKPKPKTKSKPKPVSKSKTKPKSEIIPDVRKILLNSLSKPDQNNKNSRSNKISQRELDLYISMLREQINRSWLIPDAAYHSNLSTKVKFTVSKSGHVTGAKIIQSSGNREFDSSILSAFSRIGRVGKTPNNEPITITLTFKAEK